MKDIDIEKNSDWHPADVVASLRKSGWSLRRLSAAHDYHPQTLSRALHHPYPKAERIIAKAIGVPARDIWPDRYQKRQKRCLRSQCTHAYERCNKQSKASA